MRLSKLRIALLLTSAAGLMAVPMADAQAGGEVFSRLEVSNFVIRNSADNSIVALNDEIESIAPANSADISAALTGFAPDSESETGGFNPIDLPNICLGDCTGVVENDFTELSQGTQTFSRADQDLAGAVIDGISGVTAGATARLVGEVDIDQGGLTSGTATGNVSNGSTFDLTVGTTFTPVFDFGGLLDLEARLAGDNDPILGLLAQATSSFIVSISRGDETLFSWSPDGLVNNAGIGVVETSDPFALNRDVSVNLPGDFIDPALQSGAFLAEANFALLAGETYRFSIRGTTEADLTTQQEVPEPASLALLGAGLVGLGALASRRTRRRRPT